MRAMCKTTLWLALVGAVSAAALAAPQGGPPGLWGGEDEGRSMERFHERRLERLTVFLDLSEQQIAEWEAVHESRRGEAEDHLARMRALHERIEQMAGAESPDATAVGELVIEAHRLRQEARAERERIHDELMTVLTPEQRERFEAIRDLRPERGSRGRPGHRMRGPHRGGPGAEED